MTLAYALIAAFLLPGSGPRSQAAEPLKVDFYLSPPDRTSLKKPVDLNKLHQVIESHC